MGLNEVFKKVAVIERNATELASERIELALLNDLSNIMMESGSLLVLQKQQLEAAQKLDKSIVLNKKGLAEAQRGLKAATDLGEPKAIEIFKGWVKSFTNDLARAEKGKKLVAALSNV